MSEAREEAMAANRRVRQGPGTQPKTDEKLAAVLVALEDGCSRGHAAALAGINAQTLTRWIEEDTDFERQVMAAEGECQSAALATVRKASKNQWQAAAWLLERRFPDTYARKFELPHSERVRMASRVGEGVADSLVTALAEAGLGPEQQEAVRRKLTASLEKAL